MSTANKMEEPERSESLQMTIATAVSWKLPGLGDENELRYQHGLKTFTPTLTPTPTATEIPTSTSTATETPEPTPTLSRMDQCYNALVDTGKMKEAILKWREQYRIYSLSDDSWGAVLKLAMMKNGLDSMENSCKGIEQFCDLPETRRALEASRAFIRDMRAWITMRPE
jgi:hypothetical protein